MEIKLPIEICKLVKLFNKKKFEISLVGGSVRDIFLSKINEDFDFTTNARPNEIIKIVQSWSDNLWSTGKQFGTIGIQKNNKKIEITTYRADTYNTNSRKPSVKFGNSIENDLKRRDFTINAIAIQLSGNSQKIIDPFNGVNDIKNKIIKTPLSPFESFSDDPLRMLRAFRFSSTLGFDIEIGVIKAITKMAQRINIVSKERINQELKKLILGSDPIKAIDEMVYSGLCEYFFPEIPAMQIDTNGLHKDIYTHSLNVLKQGIKLEDDYFNFSHQNPTLQNPTHQNPTHQNQQNSPNSAPQNPTNTQKDKLILRLALLMHDIGKVKTRQFHHDGTVSFLNHDIFGAKLAYRRLKILKFDKDVCKSVAKLIELHLRFYGYADSNWTDSAVRRYIIDAGPLLNHLHVLTKADNTSKNIKKLKRLELAYENLEIRITEIQKKEELSRIRPELNGNEIMKLLNLKEGPEIGNAYNYLLSQRIENGEIGKNRTKELLLKWYNSKQVAHK